MRNELEKWIVDFIGQYRIELEKLSDEENLNITNDKDLREPLQVDVLWIVNKHKKNVLSDEAFKILKTQVEETFIEDNKTKLILSIGEKGYITSNQLLQLLQTYDFNIEKMNCIKKIYPSIADKVNVNILLTTISSELSKDELIKICNSQ